MAAKTHLRSLVDTCVDLLCSTDYTMDCECHDVHVQRCRLACRLERLLPAGCFLPLPLAEQLIPVLAQRHKLSERLLDVFFSEECQARPRMLPLYARHVPVGSLGNVWRFSQITHLDISFSNIYSSHGQYDKQLSTPGILSELAVVCADGLRVLRLSNVSGDVGLDALPLFSHLQHLDVSQTIIAGQIIQDTCLSNKGELTYLDVSGTGSLSLVHLMPALQHLDQLSYLGVQKALLGVYEDVDQTSSLADVVNIIVDSFGKMKNLSSIDMGSMRYGTYTHFGCVVLEEMKSRDFLAAILPRLRGLTSLDVSFTDHLSLSDVVAELTSCDLLNNLLFLGFATVPKGSYQEWAVARTLSQSDHLRLAFIESSSPGSYNLIDATPLLQEKYIQQQQPVLGNILYRLTRGDDIHDEPVVHVLGFILQCLCLLGSEKDRLWQVVSSGVLNRLPRFDPKGTIPMFSFIKLWEQVLEEVCYLVAIHSEHFLRLTLCNYSKLFSGFLVERPLLFNRFCCLLVQWLEGNDEEESEELQNKAIVALSSIADETTSDQTLWLVNNARLLDICVTLSRKCYVQVYEENDNDNSEYLYNVVKLIWKLCDGLSVVCQHLISPEGFNFLPFLLQLAWKLQECEFGNDAVPVLGLLSTLAEVHSLRSQIRQSSLLQLFRYLPGKETNGQVVHLLTSYLAGLLCMDIEAETTVTNFKDILLQQISDVMQLDSDDIRHEMYYITSFTALLEMTQCIHTPVLVSFSLWRIAMLFQDDADYYTPLLKRDGGIAILQSLVLPAQGEAQCQHHRDSILEFCSRSSHDY